MQTAGGRGRGQILLTAGRGGGQVLLTAGGGGRFY